MRLNGTTAFSEIATTVKLGEPAQVPKRVQILKVGKFSHPQYGEFIITPLMLQEMKTNFEARVRGTDISFDYYHDSDKDASAWVKGLELAENGNELWADVDWTRKASEKIAERELRYFSPDFALNWKHPETGVEYKNVLFGGGLTNRPFLKEMAAIVADEINKKGYPMKTAEELQKEVTALTTKNLKLTEDCEKMQTQLASYPAPNKIAELEALIAKLQADLAAAKGEAEKELAEKNKLVEEKKLAEKETKFNLLLTEGKAVAAQKEAYMAGDMEKYISLAEKTNQGGKGSSDNSTLTDEQKTEKILKLAEEKRKADPKLSHADSVSMAVKEVK